MKTRLYRALIPCALGLAAIVLLATTRIGDLKLPTRVGTVDLARVTHGLTESKDIEAHMEQLRADAQEKMEEVVSRLRKIEADLETLKDKKNDREYHQLTYERLELASAAKARKEILQQLLDEEEGTNVRAIYLKVTDAVIRLAQQEQWDVVLRDDRDIGVPAKTPDGRPLTGRETRGIVDSLQVLYASESVDLTARLIDLMNNDYAAARKK